MLNKESVFYSERIGLATKAFKIFSFEMDDPVYTVNLLSPNLWYVWSFNRQIDDSGAQIQQTKATLISQMI